MTPPPYFPILRKAGSHVTFIRRNSMFLLARHSSLVLIFQFALFWTSVEGLAQSKSAMNHTEHTASPFTLPAQVGLTIGTLDIVDSGTLTDLELAISFEGSQTGSLNELRFTLISPTGTPMILASGNGTGVGSVVGQTLFETILDDEATTSINAGVPPYIGPHQPHESLSAFDGESITGTWRLVVLNQQAWEGDITAWSLFVEPPLPITRYVSTTGDDAGNACTNPGNPCATIAHAVGQANPGDTLEVEAGTYNEPGLIIDKQLNLRWEGVLVQ